METNKFNIIFIAFLFALAPSISAKEFIVGDGSGWILNFDYQAWASGKQFFVGDKLVSIVFTQFSNTPVGKHNVFNVNETAFQQCTVPPANEALTSGWDVITLETPGRKWYICGVGKHCELGGMKFFINVLPKPPSPKLIMVGDDKGWTLNFDYQSWAKGKEFFVGDKLVFKYPKGMHNVLVVNAAAFQQCVIPNSSKGLTSGYDVVTLTSPGRKWFICGIGKHCAFGMKLFINVLPRSTY